MFDRKPVCSIFFVAIRSYFSLLHISQFQIVLNFYIATSSYSWFDLLSPFLVRITPVRLQFPFRSSLGSFLVLSEEGSCLHGRPEQLFRNFCILFNMTFLGKWDERGERSFPGHSPVSQIATHILCILSSVVSPPALNSSAGISSGPVALRLAVWCFVT